MLHPIQGCSVAELKNRNAASRDSDQVPGCGIQGVLFTAELFVRGGPSLLAQPISSCTQATQPRYLKSAWMHTATRRLGSCGLERPSGGSSCAASLLRRRHDRCARLTPCPILIGDSDSPRVAGQCHLNMHNLTVYGQTGSVTGHRGQAAHSIMTEVSTVTRYCVSVRPNHSGFTAWLCRQGQRYPCAVWTKELRLEPVATESSGHRP